MSLIWSILIPICLSLLVLMPMSLLRSVARWWGSQTKFDPRWGSSLAFGAFSLGGLAALLWFALALWAVAISSFPFYDRFLIRCYGVGLLLVLGLRGKGRRRWPAWLISLAMVFMWFVTASME